jgi:hypothetical protein
MSSRTPYFEVLDQNRWTSTCIADTLRPYSTPRNPPVSLILLQGHSGRLLKTTGAPVPAGSGGTIDLRQPK